MKKVLILSLCAVLCAALTSCEKEKSGVYNPKKKIQKIYYENNGEKVLDQVWNWNDKTLSSIDYYYNGAVWYVDQYFYDEDNRIKMIKEDEDFLEFSYENDLLTTINYYWIDYEELEQTYKLYYDNKKLSKIEFVAYDIPEYKNNHKSNLNPLSRLIPQGAEVLEKQIQKLKSSQKGDQKIILEFTWEGKNVSRILAYLEGDNEDVMEATFTYDNKINPLKGWTQLWFDYVIGTWDDEYFTYTNTGNVLTAVYSYKDAGTEYDHIATEYTYEYDGKYPVKVTAVIEGNDHPYFVRYYEY